MNNSSNSKPELPEMAYPEHPDPNGKIQRNLIIDDSILIEDHCSIMELKDENKELYELWLKSSKKEWASIVAKLPASNRVLCLDKGEEIYIKDLFPDATKDDWDNLKIKVDFSSSGSIALKSFIHEDPSIYQEKYKSYLAYKRAYDNYNSEREEKLNKTNK